MKIITKPVTGCLCMLIFGCNRPVAIKPLTEHAVARVVNQMTAVMVHDVTNPPLASRFYAYACLAGYEVLAENDPSVRPMRTVLNNYPRITKPAGITKFDTYFTAVLAIYKTAERLQPSGYLLKKNEEHFIDSCRSLGFSEETIGSSVEYAKYICQAVFTYAKSDGYNRISNFRRYTPTEKSGSWEPTPPAYMSPVEPYFHTIRPFTLDSASQFFVADPVPFSIRKTSVFYRLMLENYKKGAGDLTQSEKDIADFWDCNPFAVQATGHMLIGLKKISPGAHWMGIASMACLKKKVGFVKAMEVFTVLSVGLTDGFINCWHSKYKTDRIRPETAIRKYLNQRWQPYLQTPPFPEYLSGHSVISGASAVILSHFFGDYFCYTDNVELPYGVPARSFKSFDEAAREAAMSRFYGGIHFSDAVVNGSLQGNKVGSWVVRKYAGL
jgi:hypothetical protein